MKSLMERSYTFRNWLSEMQMTIERKGKKKQIKCMMILLPKRKVELIVSMRVL